MRKFMIGCFFLGLAIMPKGVVADSPDFEATKNKDIPSLSRVEPNKITLGEVEDIILAPWGISLPGRVDTGADISSLDARDLVVDSNFADFGLGKRYGNWRLRLPVVGWQRVRTSMGTENRPVVEVSICLGTKFLRTPATLRDRSEMTYPFLIGRSALNGSFLVDTSRSRATQPGCPAGSLAGFELGA